MNDISPRSAAADPSGRLLELEAPGARPVWAVLDAAGARRFTGELTLACRPVVRAYFHDGEVYYAERDGDPTIGERLVEYGVLTPEELTAGTVQLGKVAHLGRLFDRVPTLERDPVELVLEVITGELLGEIADHTVESISVASYKHHPSGVSKWRRRAAGHEAPLTGEIPVIPATTGEVPVVPAPAAHLPAAPAAVQASVHDGDHEPTAEDHQMVADYERLMASTTDQVSVGEPTQQMVVPEGLRILESPAYPPPVPAPSLPRPVAEPATVAEHVPVAPVEVASIEVAQFAESIPVVAQIAEPVVEFDQVTWFEPVAETLPVAAADDPELPAFAHTDVSIDGEVPIEAEIVIAAEAEAEVAVEVAVEIVEQPSSAPFSFEFDLNKVLAQVALENDGLPFGPEHDDEDVNDDVRAAVRQALAEIEAATRPVVTDGLSAAGFQLALETAPDSPADIVPAGQLTPRLSGRALMFKQPVDSDAADQVADPSNDGQSASDGELAVTGTPSVGLRRLMGGTRKP